MKKFYQFIIIIITGITLTSCQKNVLTGKGEILTEERTATAFTGVRIDNDAEVTIIKGDNISVKLNGYANLVSNYTTKTEGNTLVLKFKDEFYNIHNNNIKITITTPVIETVYSNGSANMQVKGLFTGNKFSAYINGSGNLNAESQYYNHAEFYVNGSGNIQAGDFKTGNNNVYINGSGTATVQADKALGIIIHGSGKVYYKGNPQSVNTEISGSGKVVKQ